MRAGRSSCPLVSLLGRRSRCRYRRGCDPFQPNCVHWSRPQLAAADSSRLSASAPTAPSGSCSARAAARLRKRATAGDAVVLHLRQQLDELVARDPGVRLDLPDSLHKARVATRRLRSALKTFRPLLDRTVTDPLRDELAYLAGVL